ncbi:MAG: response regulator [Oscillospiraceae bacterium]|nr:response regulator [Oscillospiraceae bacterium]
MMDESVRVWIAESDPAQGRYLAELVGGDKKYDVLGVSASGRETLEVVEKLHPDVLLLALALREFDGLYVLEKISSSTLLRYPRIAVISAMASLHGERVIELGADICFPKPVNENSLIEWLNDEPRAASIAQAGMRQRRQASGKALEYLGMSYALNGYAYLVEAIALSSMDHMATRRMMSELYPRVAHTFQTSVPCVERAIRHAIEETWTNGRLSAADKLFGYSVDPKRGKPTNSECIARLGEYVRFLLAGGDDLHFASQQNN